MARMTVIRDAAAIGLLLLVARLAPVAAAQEISPEEAAADMLTPQVEQGIARGLAWLASRQQADGAFGSGAYRGNVAVTALSGMAMLAGGSAPNRGPYGEQVARAVDYLLAQAQPSGFITAEPWASHGPMYGHGFATLFLAECYGMTPESEVRQKLAAAVRLIVNSQNEQGGWRYFPVRNDADISVTVCQVMALRAARNAGIHVPSETIDRSIAYVKKCQNPDGGFRYMLEQEGDSAPARSAAGLVSLYSAGIYEGPEIAEAIDYLLKFMPEPDSPPQQAYFFYGQYYAIQAMWQAGGLPWRRWYPAISEQLLAQQRQDGSFSSQICPEYATGMACIVWQLPENHLPIFQR